MISPKCKLVLEKVSSQTLKNSCGTKKIGSIVIGKIVLVKNFFLSILLSFVK